MQGLSSNRSATALSGSKTLNQTGLQQKPMSKQQKMRDYANQIKEKNKGPPNRALTPNQTNREYEESRTQPMPQSMIRGMNESRFTG